MCDASGMVASTTMNNAATRLNLEVTDRPFLKEPLMKLIVLILGLVIGAGGGIWYGAQHPEWAKDFAAKEEEWVRQGKEQAFKAVKEKLDSLASSGASTPAGGRTFAGSTSTGSSGADAAALKGFVDDQLTKVSKK
jgi:hypothetical protein